MSVHWSPKDRSCLPTTSGGDPGSQPPWQQSPCDCLGNTPISHLWHWVKDGDNSPISTHGHCESCTVRSWDSRCYTLTWMMAQPGSRANQPRAGRQVRNLAQPWGSWTAQGRWSSTRWVAGLLSRRSFGSWLQPGPAPAMAEKWTSRWKTRCMYTFSLCSSQRERERKRDSNKQKREGAEYIKCQKAPVRFLWRGLSHM